MFQFGSILSPEGSGMNLRFPPEIRRLPISEEMVVYLFTSVELVNKPVNTAVAYEKGCDMLKAFEFTANFK